MCRLIIALSAFVHFLYAPNRKTNPDGHKLNSLPSLMDAAPLGRISLDYSSFGDETIRHVVSEAGERRSSVVASVGLNLDEASAFDQAWLRSTTWPTLPEDAKSVTVADLFCGSGGLSLGAWEAARALGFKANYSLAVDNDFDALQVFNHNLHPSYSLAGDIDSIVDGALGKGVTAREGKLLEKIEQIDLLLAGPPCQGHSDLNNYTRRDDPRNSLVLRVVRFAELTQPRHILIENVQGALRDKNGVFQVAESYLESLGYRVSTFLLDGADIGVPQRRRRCFMIATLNGFPPTLAEIKALHGTQQRTFDWACSDLDTIQSSCTFDTSAKVYPQNQRRMEYLIEQDVYELPDAERPDCHKLKDHGYDSVYGRLYPNTPAPTITTGFGSPGQGRFTHPRFPRTITPHEAARLQSFPDFFTFGISKRKKLQKIIGNAVPPKMAFAVLLSLLDA